MPTLVDLSKAIRPQVEELFSAKEMPPSELFENIEALLSYLAEDYPWLTAAKRLGNRGKFLDVSRLIAEKVRSDQEQTIKSGIPDWLDALVNKWHEKRADVITFNYDVFIEISATKIKTDKDKQKITNDNIYPVPIKSLLSRKYSVWAGDPHESMTYYKMHGSINWLYSGSEDYYGETIFAGPLRESKVVERDTDIQVLKRALVPLVVPPTMSKSNFFFNETIRGIWQGAGEALQKAERIFCLGYSFPLTDMMVRYFILTNQSQRDVDFYWVNIAPHQDGLEKILPESYHLHECYVSHDAIPRFVDDYINGKIKS